MVVGKGQGFNHQAKLPPPLHLPVQWCARRQEALISLPISHTKLIQNSGIPTLPQLTF